MPGFVGQLSHIHADRFLKSVLMTTDCDRARCWEEEIKVPVPEKSRRDHKLSITEKSTTIMFTFELSQQERRTETG